MNNKRNKETRRLDLSGKTIGTSRYNLIMGLVIIWGILINLIMGIFLEEAILKIPIWGIIIAYFIGSFISIFIVYESDIPIISFIGFTGLAISMGLLLTYTLPYYKVGTIIPSFIITGIVTFLMMIISSIFPKFFLKLGRTLFISLLIMIIVEIVLLLVGGPLLITDYIVALIFCGYIGYDWAKAQEYPPTLDNAIDSAADIYIDVVNLFIEILEIFSNSDD